jgi:hypothetical protein
MHKALINEWQAAGYVVLLTGLLTYIAAIAPYWPATSGLGAGAILLAPLGLSQACIRLRRPGLAYYFALQGAVVYLMLLLVGGMELLAAQVPTAFDGLLLATALVVLAGASVSSFGAVLALRAVVLATSARLGPPAGRVRIGER